MYNPGAKPQTLNPRRGIGSWTRRPSDLQVRVHEHNVTECVPFGLGIGTLTLSPDKGTP